MLRASERSTGNAGALAAHGRSGRHAPVTGPRESDEPSWRHPLSASQKPTVAQSDVVALWLLSLAPAVGHGIGRFGYSLVLPDMRASLGWTWSEAGLLNTANSIGYLAGALAAPWLLRRWAHRTVIIGGAFACALSLAASAVLTGLWPASMARGVAGVGAGLAFVAGGAFAAGLASRHGRGAPLMLGIFYVGPGIGLAASGVVAPLILESIGPGSWPWAWAAFGAIAAAMAVTMLALRAAPAPVPGGVARARLHLRPIMPLLLGYGAFGAGHLGYMTFVIAWVAASGGGALAQAGLWCAMALGVGASPWVGSRLAGSGGGGATAATVAVGLAAVLVALLVHDRAVLLLSAFVFGAAFPAVVASTTSFVRQNYPPEVWPAAIGAMTVAYGLGQMLGPAVVGWISDLTGVLSSALTAAAAMMGVAAALSALQRAPSQAVGASQLTGSASDE